MDKTFAISQCTSNPGLAIKAAASALVKYANNFTMKINGEIVPSITAADAPSLALATRQVPNQPVVSLLDFDAGTGTTGTILSCQCYTLIATIPEGVVNPTPVISWLAGEKFTKYVQPMTANFAQPSAHNQGVVGYVIIQNGSSAGFIPGTTALDTSGLTVTYLNNYAITAQ